VFLFCLVAISGSAFAQYKTPVESPEAFRAKLRTFMDQLAVLQPNRVTPELVASVETLDGHQLELLQNAFPKEAWFWSMPQRVQGFLTKNGAMSSIQSTGTVAQTRSAPLRIAPNTDPPHVSAFQALIGNITEGQVLTFSVTATGTGINEVELWRAMDKNNAPDPETWTVAGRTHPAVTNTLNDYRFNYTPASFGVHWYGVHVVQQDGQWATEPGGSVYKIEVFFDPNKKCPGGFDYEALWLSRDAEVVASIAKELIPEDVTTAPAYLIAAVAWAAAEGLKFSVEQVYQRYQDCSQDRTYSFIDTPLSTINGTVDHIKTTVDGLNLSNLSRLDTNVSTRADQGTVNSINGTVGTINTTTNSIKSKVDLLDLGKLDANVSTRATQSSVDNVKSKVDLLNTDKLDEKVSTRADQTTATEIKTKVNTLDTSKLDANVSTRATQSSVDTVKSKLDSLNTDKLDTNVSSRADQATANQIRDKVNTLNTGNLDVAVSTRATPIDLANATNVVMTKLNTLDTSKLDVSVATRASQASIDSLTSSVSTQQQLQMQIVEMDRSKRYLVYLTKDGSPVSGATLQGMQVITTDKNKAAVATALTATDREIAPGIHDVSFDVKGEVTAYTITFVQGSLRGSKIWADHQVQY